jgi:hypothetical protein
MKETLKDKIMMMIFFWGGIPLKKPKEGITDRREVIP